MDCQISCITLSGSPPRHEYITHVGNMDASPPWKWTREQVIQSIDNGSNTFYVLDPKTRQRSDVRVVRVLGGPAYIRTSADNDTKDNLLSLANCL